MGCHYLLRVFLIVLGLFSVGIFLLCVKIEYYVKNIIFYYLTIVHFLYPFIC